MLNNLASFTLWGEETPNSFTTKNQMTKYSSANFQKISSPSYFILRIQRLEGKQCRCRWGGSFWATSSRSTLFANSAIFVSGTYRAKGQMPKRTGVQFVCSYEASLGKLGRPEYPMKVFQIKLSIENLTRMKIDFYLIYIAFLLVFEFSVWYLAWTNQLKI